MRVEGIIDSNEKEVLKKVRTAAVRLHSTKEPTAEHLTVAKKQTEMRHWLTGLFKTVIVLFSAMTDVFVMVMSSRVKHTVFMSLPRRVVCCGLFTVDFSNKTVVDTPDTTVYLVPLFFAVEVLDKR